MIPGDLLLSACLHRQFHTLLGLLDSWAALPNSNPNACVPMQGGSLYHFYDGLWYDPAERRTHDLLCERLTRYRLSQPDSVSPFNPPGKILSRFLHWLNYLYPEKDWSCDKNAMCRYGKTISYKMKQVYSEDEVHQSVTRLLIELHAHYTTGQRSNSSESTLKYKANNYNKNHILSSDIQGFTMYISLFIVLV